MSWILLLGGGLLVTHVPRGGDGRHPLLLSLVALWLLEACSPAADLTLARRQACLVPGGDGPPPPVSPAECARRGGQSLYSASAAPAVSAIHGAEEERVYDVESLQDNQIGHRERPDPNAGAEVREQDED